MTDTDPSSLVDIHSHLVPGVDDGARTVEAAVSSAERMALEGIGRIVTTPHIRGSLTHDVSRYEERLEEVTAAFEHARAAIAEAAPEMDFRRGHEVLMDVPEVDLSDPRIRLAGTSFVLIEWPRLQIPPGTARVLQAIREQGFRPIIAHPERYSGMTSNLDIAGRWRGCGAYLQLNFGSIVGRYGKGAQTAAFQLLRQGWADYLATDFHGRAALRTYKTEAWAQLEARDALAGAELLAITNPSRLLSDLEPLSVPSLPPDPGFLGRLQRMLQRART